MSNDAVAIANARMAEIERRKAALANEFPEIAAAAERFKAVFGCCIVRNVVARPVNTTTMGKAK